MAEYKVVDSEKLDGDLRQVADKIRTISTVKGGYDFPEGFTGALDAVIEEREKTAAAIEDQEILIAALKETLEIQSSGGYAGLNISYGDTPPEDTSKLWVKTSKPSGVIVAEDKMYEDGYREESISTLSNLLPTWLETWSSARVGDKIYLFGGEQSLDNFTSLIIRFDVSTETCEIVDVKLPQVMGKIGCAAVGTKIYLIGGGTTNKVFPSVLIFDAETETLTTSGLNYPNTTSCCYIGCAVVGTSIYTFGGTSYSAGGRIDLIMELKTDTLEWVDRQISLPIATYGMSCATIGTKIYIIGGLSNGNIYCYDTETHTVSTLPCTFVYSNRTMGCCVVGSKIYLLGGYQAKQAIFCLDTEKNEVSRLSTTLPSECGELTASLVGKDIYVLGNGSQYIYKFSYSINGLVLKNGTFKLVTKADGKLVPIVNTNNTRIETRFGKAYKGNADDIGEEVETAIYEDDTWTTI